MRDNWNIDELSDQAWEKMKTMLDQEMPVQSDSRKPILFWWFWMAAAVVLVGTVAWLWFRTPGAYMREGDLAGTAPTPTEELNTTRSAEPAATINDQTAMSIPEANTSAAAIDGGDQRESQVVPTNNPPSYAMDSEVPQVAGNTSGKGMAEADAGEEDEQIKAIALQSGPESEDDTTAEKTPRPAGAIAQEKISTTTAPEQVVVDNPTQEKELFIIENLPALTMEALDQKPLPLSRINVYTPKRPLLVPLEINAGLIAATGSSGVVGGMTELRTGLYLHDAARWLFQLGVGLHLQRDPFRISRRNSNNRDQADSLETPNQGNPTNDPGIIANNRTLAEAVASSETHLRTLYLDVPMLFDWQFARHWSVATGVRLSWLLGAAWDSEVANESLGFSGVGNNLDLALSNSNKQYTIYNYGFNNIPTTLSLSNFYTSGTLGVTYRPNLKWNVRLQYQHSLTNQLDNSVYQKVDRSLWLSAGIRF